MNLDSNLKCKTLSVVIPFFGGSSCPGFDPARFSPKLVALTPSQEQRFQPEHLGESGSYRFHWLVDGVEGGSAEVGFIVGGKYTAASTAGTHTITARLDSGASADAQAFSPGTVTNEKF